MSDPADLTLLDLATAYALDAVTDDERADIEHRVAAAPASVGQAFWVEVQAVRETMAVVSAHTALEPPAPLRATVMAAVEPTPPRVRRWRAPLLAAAAALLAAVIATGVTLGLRSAPTPSAADHVFAAPDVHAATAPLPSGGTATVLFSRQRNAAVVVMNDVAPPRPGTVYEMWLLGENGPRPAGTMDAAAVKPSTTAVLSDLGPSTAFAITVEPGTGSAHPTTAPVLKVPLG
ncbi:anti-sigma factor [Mycobacterium sp. E2462]|uniref:anti-sigma factor n=1 Tax=unclassified Mycobacterium TaxID=2642494 RepID=UPI0007FF3C59|nr:MULTISPECIES: anti-sigma factor [unclassified Mycobacterium]OBG74604.1 anti-sigma factor [Mycobacterium sp. E1214]OBH30646.1 anti-sigma factor [Mycobacterium sp. E1319]OBI09878.1 anti-sigma factor [Mycobacterium sp. E2462]